MDYHSAFMPNQRRRFFVRGLGPYIIDGEFPNPPKPYEIDLEAKEMLWTLSEAATGESLVVGS